MRKYCVLSALMIIAAVSEPFAQFRGKGSDDLNTHVYLNGRIKSGPGSIHSFLLLPPVVIKANWAGIEGEEDQTDEVRAQVSNLVAAAMRKRGWEVDDSSLSLPVLQKDSRLRTLVDYLHTSHANLLNQIKNRPGDTQKGRYSIGPDIANLGAKNGIDAVVFVQSNIYSKWDERQATMRFSFADPETGEILCYLRIVKHSPSKLSPEGRIEFIAREFKRIPD